jgi:hypothetical protein
MLEINFEGKIDYDQFMLNLTSLALAPLRDDIVSKSDDWAKKPGTMVCSGPFKLGRINVKTSDTDKYFDALHEYVDDNGFDKIGVDGKALVITENVDEKVVKSARNIPGVTTTTATILSPYTILNNRVLVVDKAALQKIEEVFA